MFEPLLVITLACTMMLVTIPSLHFLMNRVRLKQEVWQWVARIHDARELSLQRHEKIVLCPSRDGTNCGGNWNQFILVKNEKTVFKQYEPMEDRDVTWQGFPIQKPYLAFSAWGMLENENGTFTYCIQENCKKIIIARSGRIRLA